MKLATWIKNSIYPDDAGIPYSELRPYDCMVLLARSRTWCALIPAAHLLVGLARIVVLRHDLGATLDATGLSLVGSFIVLGGFHLWGRTRPYPLTHLDN